MKQFFKNSLKASISLLSLLAIFQFPLLSWGTTFVEQPFPETVNETPVIVRGQIENQNTDWVKTSEGIKQIYTIYDLKITEVFKSKGNLSNKDKDKTIQIRELGGEKDGIGLEISGVAHFDMGEDVVVMLKDVNSDGSYDVSGMMMGKYNLKKDDSGQEILIGPGIPSHTNSESSPLPSLHYLRRIIQEDSAQDSKNTRLPTPSSDLKSSQVSELQNPTSKILNQGGTDSQTKQKESSESILQEKDSESNGTIRHWFEFSTGGALILILFFFRRKKRSSYK